MALLLHQVVAYVAAGLFATDLLCSSERGSFAAVNGKQESTTAEAGEPPISMDEQQETGHTRAVPQFLPPGGKLHMRGVSMASYLVQVSYTAEAIRALMAKPQNRTAVVKKAVENLGGTLGGSWMSFGDYDLVMLVEMPNNVSAAALAIAAAAGGSLKSIKTTPLLTVEQGMAALKKAGKSGYTPVKTD